MKILLVVRGASRKKRLGNLDRGYVDRRITIYTDSQAAIKALSGYTINSGLADECRERLADLASRNAVRLEWIPAHSGFEGNEMADALAAEGAAAPYCGPGATLGLTKQTIRKETGKWLRNQHLAHWNALQGPILWCVTKSS